MGIGENEDPRTDARGGSAEKNRMVANTAAAPRPNVFQFQLQLAVLSDSGGFVELVEGSRRTKDC